MACETTAPDERGEAVAGGRAEALRIAFVCSANRFRSPLAEGFLRAALSGLPVEVESYGVLRGAGEAALPQALQLATARGVDISGHRVRSLRGARLDHAELVIGFELIHLSSAVLEAGAARNRTFTLPELVSTLACIDPPRLGDPLAHARAVVELAAASSHARTVPEIPDPVGGPASGYREVAATIHELVIHLAESLFPSAPARRHGATPDAAWRRRT